MKATEINKEITNKLFINSRGNFVHIKSNHDYHVVRGEKCFDLCEASTREEAIKIKTGRWAYTRDIQAMINRGSLIPC